MQFLGKLFVIANAMLKHSKLPVNAEPPGQIGLPILEKLHNLRTRRKLHKEMNMVRHYYGKVNKPLSLLMIKPN